MVKNTFSGKNHGKNMENPCLILPRKRGGGGMVSACQPGQFSELLPIKESSVAVAPGQSDSSVEFSEGP